MPSLKLPYIPNQYSNTPLVIDLEFLATAESREHEIAFANPTKGPELMSVFAVTISKLAELLPKVHFQHRMAEKRAAERRAVVLIEVVPAKIAASDKKLAQNAETREALIQLDPEYSQFLEDEMVIEAALLLLKEKLYSMKNNLATVQKIYEQTQSFMYMQNQNLIATPSQLERPPQVSIDWAPEPSQHITQPPMKVGKATY